MSSTRISFKRLSCTELRAFTYKVFERGGLEYDGAMQAADVLCTADEWGIRSHGVARLRAYYQMLSTGRINAKAKPRILAERSAMALIDGDNGLGLVVGPFANGIAMSKAKAGGIGWVNVANSNHFGIAGYYAVQGLKSNLIGLCMTNTPPLVSPFGGAERKLGTNPISLAFPGCEEPPIIVDMATSAISLGQVQNAQREGRSLSSPSVANSLGEPSINPNDLFNNGFLLPLGGTDAGAAHKGYCLASIVDILCGVFSGASWGPFVPPFLNDSVEPQRNVGRGVGHLFVSVFAGSFEDQINVRRRADDWVREMRETKPARWASKVMVPGDPEHLSAETTALNGVILENSVFDDLERLSLELDLPFIEDGPR